uniref:Odorant receptor n=1 Tax=Tetranychus urticae TaxID=32264 RepID=T1KSJ6_TETUR
MMNFREMLFKFSCNCCSMRLFLMSYLDMESDNLDRDSNSLCKSFGFKSIELWLTRKSKVKLAVELLDELEDSGNRWLCTLRGYQQKSSVTRRKIFVNWILALVGLVITLKTFLTTFISNKFIGILLGDIFFGLPGHDIQNMLLTMIFLLSSGVKHVGFEKERLNRYKILRVYHKLRETQFEYDELMLSQHDCTQIRKFIYLFGQFYKIDSPAVSIAIPVWLLLIYLTNPVNQESLFNAIITGLWTLITAIVFIYGAYATVWSFIHNTLIVVFVIHSLKSLYSYGESILDQGCSEAQISKYLTQQNRIYNLVHQHVVEMGMVTGYGIFVVSCTGNFALFVSIFIGTGSNLTDYVILAVGCMNMTSIVTLNTVGALSANMILSCRALNYRIARRIRCQFKYKLKLLMTCERLNLTRIGFSTGGIYKLDSESFLLYLLENAGLMLMFITNFNKLNTQ